jgi:acyl-CoA synthetase (AMP-forming)/AMP-acid ligase II
MPTPPVSRPTLHGADTVIDVLHRQARERPAQPFCHAWQDGRIVTVTLGELWHRTRAAAAGLAQAGVAAGDVVLIAHRHDRDLYPAFLAPQLLGAIPSFMPFPSEKQDAERYWRAHVTLFDRLRPAAVIASVPWLAQFETALGALPTARIPLAGLCDGPPIASWTAPAPDTVALLQHSSGTTGEKKGVMLTHRAICTQVASYAPTLALGNDAVIASWLPLYHDMGLIACFMLPLLTGTPLVALDPFAWSARPVLLLDAIVHHRATHAWLPNFAFHHLVRAVDPGWAGDLSSMRAWIDCSEPCTPETFERFLARHAASGVAPGTLQCCYAMAETVFAVTQTPVGTPPCERRVAREPLQARRVAREAMPGEPAVRIASVGTPIDALTIAIRDEDGHPLPDGHVGEVTVQGRCLFDGYFRDPEPDRAAWWGGWYRTGDLGFVHDGALFITGRRKEVLIVNGRNFFAHDIEAAVNTVAGVKPGRAVAFGVPNAEVGSEQVIVIVEVLPGTPDLTALPGAVRAAVADALGLTVHRVVPVAPGWLLKTTSGKISRALNQAKWLEEGAGAGPTASSPAPAAA